MTDLQICDYLVQQYAGTNVFDRGESGNGDHGICWHSVGNDIYLRGSKKFEDYVVDILQIPIPFEHDIMGPVHDGFCIGMVDLANKIVKFFGLGPVNLHGHSLGAARACILVVLLKRLGVTINKVTLFGCPKVGYNQFVACLQMSAKDVVSYRNGNTFHHDLITDLPMIPFEFVHPVNNIVQVNTAPKDNDWGCFSWHHLELYREGLVAIWK